jgi:hypothetical protein
VSAELPGEPDDDFTDLDSDEEQWLEEWEQADREAVDVLTQALSDRRGAPPPDGLAAAAAAARPQLGRLDGPLGWVCRAAGLDPQDLPGDDVELLLCCTAATISPEEETGLEVEEEALLVSLEHADWLGSIVTLVRAGPGADASPRALVDGIRTCPEVELESELDVDDESHLDAAFSIVALPWHVLGLVDDFECLTELGAWVLPRGLARAWRGNFDQEPDD